VQVLLPAEGSTSGLHLGVTSVMGLAALGSFQIAFARQTAAEESRSALVIAAVCLAMTLLDALMLTAGRQCIALWHMRYNLYVSVFPAVAVGILAGLSLTTLPRKVAPLLVALLLVGAALVAQRNVNVVLASTWMVDRAPGFVKSMQSPE
jgi:hypothetical protein